MKALITGYVISVGILRIAANFLTNIAEPQVLNVSAVLDDYSSNWRGMQTGSDMSDNSPWNVFVALWPF